MKKIVIGFVVLGALIGGFFAFNAYIYNEKQATGDDALGAYFQEEMFSRAVEDGLMPIEGFDAGLLMGEYPALIAQDFIGVEAFEGVYSIEEGELVFTRTYEQPVSSAERTISQAGYSTLLKNVSERLERSVSTEAEIDQLINVLKGEDPNARFERVTDENLGFAFSYRTEPNGYTLIDTTADNAPHLADYAFVKGYSLMLTNEYEELQNATEPREGPPTISILVFENTENQSASVWVEENTFVSNTGLLVGEINSDAALAGAQAVKYTFDGLYTNDAVVVAHGGFIYQFLGAYSTAGDRIRDDFQSFLMSVQFVPVPNE